jgi:hypothetical protein
MLPVLFGPLGFLDFKEVLRLDRPAGTAMSETNKCPHPSCARQKPREVYACRPHWQSLPKKIRNLIWDGYRSSPSLWLKADKMATEFWVSRENVTCPYCQGKARVLTGMQLYRSGSSLDADLARKLFWACIPCQAWVGCHPDTQLPLGRLANAELRRWKQAAHAAFDPRWKNMADPRKSRSEAYAWLAAKLGLPVDETHIGMFDVERCKAVIEACKEPA